MIENSIIQQFYKTYGRPGEGPPNDVDIDEIFPKSDKIQEDLELLQTYLSNDEAKRDFEHCRDILEEIANIIGEDSEILLQELQNLSFPNKIDLDHLTNGVFWFTLASQMHPKDTEDLSLPTQIPAIYRQSIQTQGALVFKLYIGLVYIREGALNEILAAGSTARMPTLVLCRKLLNCDYVRHIRNALSHANFSPIVSGMVFTDKKHQYIASPGFLDWLCTWLFTIYFSCMCVLGNDNE